MKGPATPLLGLLVQTVVPSPIIRKILQWNGKLVSIGTSAISILQYDSGGNLLDERRTIQLPSDINNAVVAWRSIILVMATGQVYSLTEEGVSRLEWFKELNNPYSGACMVTDPAQRFLAITSTESSVLILHQPKQANLLTVTGVIMEMCFLYPEQEDPSHVVLLLLIARKGGIRAVSYDWDADGPLSAMNCSHENGVAIDRALIGKGAPLLLIPLEDPRHYVMFFDGRGAAIFRSGNLPLELVRTLDNVGVEPPRVGYSGRYSPLWTAWSRHPGIGVILVGREDGLVVAIKSFSGRAISFGGLVVNLECNIEGAFACVDVNLEGSSDDAHHFLFVGGVTGPGHVYQIKKDSFSQLSILPNWAPVYDVSSIPASEGSTKTIPAKLVARCGRDAESFNAELTRNIKADVSLRLKVGSQVNGIWAIEEGFRFDHREYDRFTSCILISLLHSTIMLRAEKGTDKFELATQEDTWFDLSSRTLAASLGGLVSAQVTERDVRLSSWTNLQPIYPHNEAAVTRKSVVEGEPSPRCAFVYDNQLALLAFADPEGGSVSVFKLGHDLTGGPRVSRFYELSYSKCPQSMSVLSLGGYDYLVASHTVEEPLHEKMVPSEQLTFVLLPKSPDGEFIRPFNADGEFMKPAKSTSALGYLPPSSSEQRGAFISPAILTRPGVTSGLLIAGHQRGFLSYVTIKPNDAAQIVIATGEKWQGKSLGSTDVNICPDPANRSKALVYCDDGLWLVTFETYGPHITTITWDGKAGNIHAITPFGNRFLMSVGDEVLALALGEESISFSPLTQKVATNKELDDLKTSIQHGMGRPVSAIAMPPHQEHHLVACFDNELLLLRKGEGFSRICCPIVTLPSRGVAIQFDDCGEFVHVLTSQHSVISFSVDIAADKLSPTFQDPEPRPATDQLAFEHENCNVVLVSDKHCGVTGLSFATSPSFPFAPSCSRSAPKPMAKIFEAQLPSSITKFQLVSCRSSWDAARLTGDNTSFPGLPKWGNALRGEELLGVSIDGAVYHFTLLEGSLLELLELLREFRGEMDKVDDMSEIGADGTFGSVDGEVVMKWLNGRELYQFLVERMVAIDDEVQSHAGEFVATVKKWQGHGQSSDGLSLSGLSLDDGVTKEMLESCVEDVYKILQFLSRPVV